MLTAKTLQAVGEGPTPQVRTTAHNEAGRLAPGVGVDHPDFAVFLHFALGSETHADQNVLKRTFCSHSFAQKTN